jgi:excinuclease ABC subunit C
LREDHTVSHQAIRDKIKAFPKTPGVYLMKDDRGRVIYVGKAKSLRDRVRSYFADSPSDTRTLMPRMVADVADVEYVEAEDELDALLKETRLIKDLRPRYNQDLRDGKTYPYLEVTRGEDFPAVYVTRRTDNARSRYYGPFTDVMGLRRAVQMMQRAFRYRTCSMEILADDPKRRFQRPCLLYSIRRCLGPCADLVSRQEYEESIAQFGRFLDGKRSRLTAEIEREMWEASERRDFERAARLRDRLRAVQALGKRGERDLFPETSQAPVVDPRQGMRELQALLQMPSLPRTVDGLDVAQLGGDAAVASVVRFVDGRPFKEGYRRFRIKTVEGVDDCAMIGEVVTRRFQRLQDEEDVMPDILLIDGGPAQLHAALARLSAFSSRPARVLSLAKREELVYVEGLAEPLRLGRREPSLRLLQYVRDEAHRFAQHYHHLLRLKSVVDRKQRRRRKSNASLPRAEHGPPPKDKE